MVIVMKPALLVIDVQERFFEISPETAASLRAAIWFINQALALFRERALPIVVVQHVDPAEGLVPGAPGFEVSPALDLRPEDTRVLKTYGNAFNKTDLEAILRGAGVDTVVLSGFAAEYCVTSTFRGALDRDFTAVTLRSALAGVNPADIPVIERINDSVSLRFLKKAIE